MDFGKRLPAEKAGVYAGAGFPEANEMSFGGSKEAGKTIWECSECRTLGSLGWKRYPVCEAKMGGKGDKE